MHLLHVAPLGIDDEDGAPSPAHVRLEDRACGAYLNVEALAHDGGCVRVEQHGDLVARRVLHLLHHQLAAPCGRAPVHTAERLSLRILAHAVELEAAVAAQEQPPPVRSEERRVGKECQSLWTTE